MEYKIGNIVNSPRIPVNIKVKLIEISTEDKQCHLNKEGFLSREMSPIWTMPGHENYVVAYFVVIKEGKMAERFAINKFDKVSFEVIEVLSSEEFMNIIGTGR
jgi:hypothetical protein